MCSPKFRNVFIVRVFIFQNAYINMSTPKALNSLIQQVYFVGHFFTSFLSRKNNLFFFEAKNYVKYLNYMSMCLNSSEFLQELSKVIYTENITLE